MEQNTDTQAVIIGLLALLIVSFLVGPIIGFIVLILATVVLALGDKKNAVPMFLVGGVIGLILGTALAVAFAVSFF